MQTFGFFFQISLLFIFYISSFSIALTKVQYPVSRRGLSTLRHMNLNSDPETLLNFKIEVDPSLNFISPRIKTAYVAFQEWKKAIYSDPFNMTGNWVGPNVCSYNGIVCTEAPDDQKIVTVGAVDINFCDIAGQLVPQLGLLTDLGILHLHSNRFFGIFPETLSNLKLLFELDVSNNRFVGPFPSPVLGMTSMRFLDIRFNEFEGPLPPGLFELDIDALLVNNNRFYSHLPKNMGNSPASVLVLSNNKFSGCIPPSFGHMPNLEQVSFSNNRLTGCLPEEIGMLKFLIFLDASKNYFIGSLPKSLERLKSIEKFDFSQNRLSGKLQDGVCSLPALSNVTIINNYFNEVGVECGKRIKEKLVVEDRENCFSGKPNQKSDKDCKPVVIERIDCKTAGCQPRDPGIIEHQKRRKSPPPPPPRNIKA